MKGLDTSVLLALLEGERGARDLLIRLRGVELATTEVNLLELSYLTAHGPPRIRVARREALDRLRRKITVLPIDGRAVEQAGRRLGKGSEKTPPHVLAMLGALEASGCDELFTREPAVDPAKWRFRITHVTYRGTK
ncbi:MAG TPA: PIN domain-containing protein [Thermoplasmata archaeon]|jgi:predicted nucleic acid-binding protein